MLHSEKGCKVRLSGGLCLPLHTHLPPICSSWEGLSLTMPVSMRLERVVITVALAGMFTPAARVSVAKTTCRQARDKTGGQVEGRGERERQR